MLENKKLSIADISMTMAHLFHAKEKQTTAYKQLKDKENRFVEHVETRPSTPQEQKAALDTFMDDVRLRLQ
jgi:hypothetical protein